MRRRDAAHEASRKGVVIVSLTPHVAHEIGADRIRAAEHHRLVVESRPAHAAGRSPLALRSRLRPARRQAVAKLAEPADA